MQTEYDAYQNADYYDHYGSGGLWPFERDDDPVYIWPERYYRCLNYYYSEHKGDYEDVYDYEFMCDRAHYYWWKAEYWLARYEGDKVRMQECLKQMRNFNKGR